MHFILSAICCLIHPFLNSRKEHRAGLPTHKVEAASTSRSFLARTFLPRQTAFLSAPRQHASYPICLDFCFLFSGIRWGYALPIPSRVSHRRTFPRFFPSPSSSTTTPSENTTLLLAIIHILGHRHHRQPNTRHERRLSSAPDAVSSSPV